MENHYLLAQYPVGTSGSFLIGSRGHIEPETGIFGTLVHKRKWNSLALTLISFLS